MWPHFGIEPLERAQTYKRVLSFAFDDRLSTEKYIAHQFTIYLFILYRSSMKNVNKRRDIANVNQLFNGRYKMKNFER